MITFRNPHELITELKANVKTYLPLESIDGVSILFNSMDIINLKKEELEDHIGRNRRAIKEYGRENHTLTIRQNHLTICSLNYKEYEYCCGKVLIYGFDWRQYFKASLENNINSILFALKLAFACSYVNGYSFADFVISNSTQHKILSAVMEQKLYDDNTIFANRRMESTCTNFIKFL